MTALTTLGVVCLWLLCLAPTIGLTVDLYQKPRRTRVGKNGKRELKINRISYWDYLIIVLPACLLLIAFLCSHFEEKATRLKILGIGYMFLILSPYNRRIDIPKINWFISTTCLILALIACLLATGTELSNSIYWKSAKTLFFPAIAYAYLMLSRQLIKLLLYTYPITLDRYFRIGQFYNRYNRKANIWDLVWTMINMGGFPLMLIYLSMWKWKQGCR